ncbi:hypothetical protein [Carboxylicivirga sp. N1Y90]|uniref:hypothetical protein n=1 Tax=Carboxylicivirga fragile TaxID=3417571 RepID=UPI003D339FCB|nr:hypothetical protein [Marinilabiliaceae bacterium N1Y90]
MQETKLKYIANQFHIQGVVSKIKALGEGFINDTYIIETEKARTPNYLMQRKNKNVFNDVPAMMNNIERVCQHLKAKVKAHGGDPMREAMTIIKTK